MRIKPRQRSNENYVDSLIASIWALYLALISFFALYAYVGVGTYSYRQAQAKLIPLDQLLALRRLTEFSKLVSMRPALTRDIPDFSSRAMEEAMDQMAAELAAEDNAEGPKPAASKFDDKPLAASQVAIDLPMRMAVNGTCDVLVTRLSPGKTFDFVTFLIVGATHRVKSENVKLANFHGCQPGPARDLQALIFQLDDGQFAFAIPRSLEEAFLGSRTTRWFENYSLEEPKWITALLPDVLKPYVELKEDFVFVHGKAIDYLILSFANSQLGKRFAPDRLDIAIQQLYEQKEKDASYFGINASGTQLIRGGPLIYFFLSFELWRRVRRLPKGKLQSGKYWFAFETSDFLGRSYAYTYALLPSILGGLIYCIFVVSQGIGLVVLGRWITLSGLVTLTFPTALGMGWYSWDVLGLCLLFFVPFQFFILFLVSRKLAAVVADNLRE